MKRNVGENELGWNLTETKTKESNTCSVLLRDEKGRGPDFFQMLWIRYIATLCLNFQNWMRNPPGERVLCLLCTEHNSHFPAQPHLLSEMQQLVSGSSISCFVCCKRATRVRFLASSAPFLAVSLPLVSAQLLAYSHRQPSGKCGLNSGALSFLT